MIKLYEIHMILDLNEIYIVLITLAINAIGDQCQKQENRDSNRCNDTNDHRWIVRHRDIMISR